MTELTDEQIAREEKFLEGIPRAQHRRAVPAAYLFPAHGMCSCYPVLSHLAVRRQHVYAAFTERTPLAIGTR